jgi:hypothetical protein
MEGVMTSNPKNAFTRYAKACRKADIGFSFGAADFSYNEDDPPKGSKVAVPAKLVVHLWTFVKAREVEVARKILKESFPKTHKAARPVKAYPYDGNLQAIAYAFKGDFSRRVKVPAEVDEDGEKVSRQNTRLRPLRVGQKVELAVLLNRLGLYDRLILRDIEFVQTPAGIRLRPKNPQV